MARISFSALVEEITGKLAGSVFQDSYGGFQIRTRVSPRNPQTQYQQLRRGEFGYLSASWRNLTSVQRQTFIDAAATPPGALNLFLQSNINLTLIEEPTITTYVASADPGPMTVVFVDASPTSILIKATGATTVVPAGTKLLIQVTYLKAPTKIFTNPSQYSPVISFDEGTDLAAPTDILTEWQSRYGVLLPDKRLCLKTALIDKSNGLRGADVVNCTNTEAMAQKYFPLFADTTPVNNVGAGLTTLLTYTLVANQFTAEHQKIIADFQLQFAGGVAVKHVELTVAGTNTVFANYAVSAGVSLRIWLQRKGANELDGIYQLSVDGQVTETKQVSLAPITFSNTIAIVVSGQSAASNQCNYVSSWLDYVSEP